MKKLDKICAILIVIGLVIVIFNGAFLDNNEIVGFIGLTISLCPIFINVCIRDKRKNQIISLTMKQI